MMHRSRPVSVSRMRSTLLFVLLSFGFLGIVARAIQLQVRPNPKLTQFVSQRSKQLSDRPPDDPLTWRGGIVDREGRDLALSVVVRSYFANPKVMKDRRVAAKRIAQAIGGSETKIRNLLSQDKFFVWIKREVDEAESKRLDALNLEGLFYKKETKRVYPAAGVGQTLIGVAGRDGVGLEGLEKTYDSYLRSADKMGAANLRDALGRLLLFNDFEREWFQAKHVQTTIDLRLQRVLEDELEWTVKTRKALSGQAILMNPHTGEILAMASKDGARAERNSLRNRAVSDLYEPGSTFKVVLAAAALEKLKMQPASQIFAENGVFQVGSNRIREYHSKKYGWMSLQELLEVSSNIAAAKLGLKMGAESLSSFMKRFGMAQATGIDLPGEAGGILREPQHWKPIDLANISFGQGFAVTPLQMIRAIAAIANGGLLVQPHLVSRVFSLKPGSGEPQEVWRPDLTRTEVFSPASARKVTTMLTKVTQPGSTGTQAAIDGYVVAGKTGTSQKLVEKEVRGRKVKVYSSSDSLVSFVGFLPADQPAFVLLVLYDDPEGQASGGNTAAPSFRRIASRAAAILGIPTKREETSDFAAQDRSKPAPTVVGQGRFIGRSFQDILSEIRQLEEAEKAKLDLVGFGTAYREEPIEGDRLRIYFR